MGQKKIYLQEMLTAGFIMGLLYSLQQVLIYSFGIDSGAYKWAFFVYGVAVIASTELIYTRRVAAAYPAEKGFNYGQCLGFMALSALLAGVIVGIVGYLIHSVIDPSYGEMILTQAREQVQVVMPGATEQQLDTAMSVSRAMMSIWGMIFSNMFSLLINGVLVGLITSAFVKRNADIFVKTEE